MNKSISIIIPNFNGKDLLAKTIPSAESAARYSGAGFEIIISDDGSSDGSVAFTGEHFPGVKIVSSQCNNGFSSAVNNGLLRASMDLVFLLNSDVLLEQDYFEEQFRYFDYPDTFGVMGRICEPVTKRTIDAAKFPQWKSSRLVTTLNYTIVSPPPGYLMPTLFLSGANALIDRKKSEYLCGMDELFNPFYMEDADLGMRAWRCGWKCYYEPKSVCYHRISSTINRYHNPGHIRKISKRNALLFHYIHLTGNRRIFWLLECLFKFIVQWIILDITWYKAFFEFLKNFRKAGMSKKKLNMLCRSLHSTITSGKVVRDIQNTSAKFRPEYF